MDNIWNDEESFQFGAKDSCLEKKMSYAVRAAVLETVLNIGDGRMTR